MRNIEYKTGGRHGRQASKHNWKMPFSPSVSGTIVYGRLEDKRPKVYTMSATGVSEEVRDGCHVPCRRSWHFHLITAYIPFQSLRGLRNMCSIQSQELVFFSTQNIEGRRGYSPRPTPTTAASFSVSSSRTSSGHLQSRLHI